MHSVTSIVIRAPRETIFHTVSQLLRWPEFLSHYKFVKEIEPSKAAPHGLLRLHMAAAGGLFPVAWRSTFVADADAMELHFEHTAAFTKGMKVVWTLTPTNEGTRVDIVHQLRFRFRPLAWLVEPILEKGFIDPVASRTLATFKRLLEPQI